MPGLLYARSISVNDHISLYIPTMGEVLSDEDNYFEVVAVLTATPYDMMVQLDDAGIDFSKITPFELFCLTYKRLIDLDTRFVTGDLDFSKFKTAVNQETEMLVLRNEEDDITIDKVLYDKIVKKLCSILWMQKEDKKPANEEARKYMIEKARKKQKRRMREMKNKDPESEIDNIIIGLVNTSEFKYNYETVKDMTIYQFYTSLNQISHKIKYDNTMHGYFAGTVKFESLSREDRSWLRL